MKSIILLAPPAAGKGTQSDLLCKKYGFIHISTGDLIREHGKTDHNYLSGKLVSDDIVLQLLKDKLQEIQKKEGYILDGFPRNVSQARAYQQMLEEMHQELSAVIYLSVDYNLALKRITGRLSCPNCGHVYNDLIEENQPIVKGVCNNCQMELTKRVDDNEDTFKVRFETYLHDTKPLITYYKEKCVLYEVDGAMSTSEVFHQIESIVNSL